jgi:hypothetical protein
MILLDTNVVSEFVKPAPNICVQRWLDACAETDLFICAPVVAELFYGVAILPAGKKKLALLASCERVEHEAFAGRILPFDERAAHRFAELRALKRSRGQAFAVMDAMIASIAAAHAMTLATRNIRDFEGLGVPLVDPFTQ